MPAASPDTLPTSPPAPSPSPSSAVTPSTPNDKQKDLDKAAAAKAKKKKKDKAKKKAKRQRKNALKTKIVVRRLPANLPEEVFMTAVKRWTGDDVVDYKFYVPGKVTQSKGKENVFSRAYFHMKTMEAVIAFHQGFDGHIFVDNRGNESRAVVEFAPFQKLPKEQKNPDSRQGTIDEDPDYLKFLDSLKAEQEKKDEPSDVGEGGSQLERLENRLAMVTAQTLAAEQANKPKTTPLLEHIRAQKAAQAAARAKAQAAKAAKKSILNREAKAKGGASGGGGGKDSPSGETPKKSRRNRKKKDKEKNKEKDDNSNAAAASSDNPKADKPPKKEGGKSKRSKAKKEKDQQGGSSGSSKAKQVNQQSKQQVVSILGRQQQPQQSIKSDEAKSKGNNSSTARRTG
ncbi:wd repeat-containing protein [Lichtheimia corymbifera JMRC:FSU:9682]|uniref:Wd repeat-containing protein n=1 Tax=Lichtheimia corymbifera JMRC:FSU:9682 TaxID=1263082 RepID=A0A068S4V2_9FUNG|nr:wd repeat-containing protein [Lichtheimia corymbifera JMRC:FSU:9682]